MRTGKCPAIRGKKSLIFNSRFNTFHFISSVTLCTMLYDDVVVERSENLKGVSLLWLCDAVVVESCPQQVGMNCCVAEWLLHEE